MRFMLYDFSHGKQATSILHKLMLPLLLYQIADA